MSEADEMYEGIESVVHDLITDYKNQKTVTDAEKYKQTLWNHTPLTDFWHIGRGTQNRLAKYNIYTMQGISECDPKILYKEFGINA